MTSKGTLFIVSAPSGAGKTSLVNALVKRVEHVQISVSHTTRIMRSGEQDGVDYHFVSQNIFNDMISKETFLEHAGVFGNYYGTSKIWVERSLQQGEDIILEIDWQGARQICELMPDVICIYIMPPSKSVLKQRLVDRNLDDLEVIKRRLEEAQAEISHYNEYDYLVINDDFETALGQLIAIVQASRLVMEKQKVAKQKLISELTS
jgi:guanylate kinase